MMMCGCHIIFDSCPRRRLLEHRKPAVLLRPRASPAGAASGDDESGRWAALRNDLEAESSASAEIESGEACILLFRTWSPRPRTCLGHDRVHYAPAPARLGGVHAGGGGGPVPGRGARALVRGLRGDERVSSPLPSPRVVPERRARAAATRRPKHLTVQREILSEDLYVASSPTPAPPLPASSVE